MPSSSQSASAQASATADTRRGPHAKGIVLYALHAAAGELWGASGLTAIGARLPPDARAASLGEPISPLVWHPESYTLAWFEAAHAHVDGDEERYRAYVDRFMDLGFGRVRRMLLRVVTPAGIIRRAAELWRHDHTHGELRVSTEKTTAVAVLSGHPYCESSVCRLAMAEVFRYALSLSRANDVRESHLLDEGRLVVRLAWS